MTGGLLCYCGLTAAATGKQFAARHPRCNHLTVETYEPETLQKPNSSQGLLYPLLATSFIFSASFSAWDSSRPFSRFSARSL